MVEATTQVQPPVERIGADTITLERLLDAPVETVWRYLTEGELRGQWFMAGSDAQPGSDLELVIDHDVLSDDDVPYPDDYASAKGKRFTDKVLRFEPPRLLETTFAGGTNGVVTYELKPEGERTHLVLTHSGIVSATGAQDFGSGWNSHLTVLQEKLAGRSIKNFWELHARSREAVRAVLG